MFKANVGNKRLHFTPWLLVPTINVQHSSKIIESNTFVFQCKKYWSKSLKPFNDRKVICRVISDNQSKLLVLQNTSHINRFCNKHFLVKSVFVSAVSEKVCFIYVLVNNPHSSRGLSTKLFIFILFYLTCCLLALTECNFLYMSIIQGTTHVVSSCSYINVVDQAQHWKWTAPNTSV